jgi:regulator of replication initiation timing
LASGKPAYKSQEDYYDEIMELRQVIKDLKADNGVLKTKLQRITQENVLKVNVVSAQQRLGNQFNVTTIGSQT